MKKTHAAIWSKRPSETKEFVSNYVNLAFPILKKRKDINKVLDVACGNGMGVTIPLMQLGLDVSSFDHLKSGIKALKINATKIGFRANAKVANMYKRFPYKDKEFDSTFCFQAIYHGRLEQIKTDPLLISI